SRQPLGFPIGEARLDGEVLALGIAELAHALDERIVAAGIQRSLARPVVEKPYARAFGRRLGERAPRHSKHARAKRDQESPPRGHWITSSARCSSDGGMVSPSALAVLRLITSSNLVGCSTGRSAGLTPFR